MITYIQGTQISDSNERVFSIAYKNETTRKSQRFHTYATHKWIQSYLNSNLQWVRTHRPKHATICDGSKLITRKILDARRVRNSTLAPLGSWKGDEKLCNHCTSEK